MYDASVSLKKSVATTLIKKVFSIYIILTIIFTLVQLSVEYFHVKESIINEIGKMEGAFEPGIAGALWNFDKSQLQSIISGMNQLSAVVGVRIDDTYETETGATGVILSGEEQILVTPEGERITSSSDTRFTPLKGLFSHSFDITYKDQQDKKAYAVGRATAYSASGVVIDRIKYGFFLIIVNSIIKTLTLWFIIFHFARKIIGKPLTTLTETTVKVNPNHPDFFNISYSPEEKRLLRSEDELGVLTRSFDKMRNAILERMDNLNRLRNIGEDLSVIREIPAAFLRIMKPMREKFAFKRGSLFLTEDQNLFEMTATYPQDGDMADEPSSFRMGEGITGKAAEKGEIVYISDAHGRPESAEETSASESLLCVPLSDEKGLSGVMNFYGTGGQFSLTGENRVFIEAVSRLAVINIKNIQMLNIIEENAKLKQEMELARRIQTSLLPDSVSDLHPDFEIAASMLPAEQVGGDFYEITLDRRGGLWLAVGDVSGHGVTPGLIMMMAQTVHTTLTASLECDARGAVVKLNQILYMNVHDRLKESHFMTFTTLRYLGDGRFQHAGAHLSMIVYRQKTGTCELVKTRGVYLNFKKDISRATKNAEFSLDDGDVLVLYTDGLTEAENPDGDILDLDRFVKIVEKHAHHIPEAMKDMIMADVIQWCHDKRDDDMTLVIVKKKEGQ